MKKFKALMLAFASASFLLASAPVARGYHPMNPCAGYPQGNGSGSWFSGIFVFSLLLLGFYVFFGSTISKKIKDNVRTKRQTKIRETKRQHTRSK